MGSLTLPRAKHRTKENFLNDQNTQTVCQQAPNVGPGFARNNSASTRAHSCVRATSTNATCNDVTVIEDGNGGAQ